MPQPVSEHETICKMYEEVHAKGITNVFDRYDAQEKTRCPYCVAGISCQLCSMGPCRITKSVDRGVCGIDGNGMVMRNLLQKDIMGISNYTIHCRDAAKTLKATALGKTPFTIKDPAKIDFLAKGLGIPLNLELKQKARQVAEAILASVSQDSEEESVMVNAFAIEKRKKVWRETGLFPGGPMNEIMDCTARSMTNIDGDYVSLAKAALRLGIACAYGSLLPLEMVQDALFGTPTPHEAEVDLGVLDPDYVNIVPNGHEPFVGAAIIEKGHSREVQQAARDAGAKGLRVVGSIETGQELMQRFPSDDVFVGVTGNWINEEMVMATGAVDALVMDNSCSLPTLGIYADKFCSTLVAVSRVIGVPGTKKRIHYLPENVAAQADEIIRLAIDNFKARKGKPAKRGLKRTKIIAGFSNEAILAALGGSLTPLLDVIKKGAIKGVVALVSCSTLKNGGQDTMTVDVAKELIKRNILVLSAGCGTGACQVGGLNSISAQEWAGESLKGICKSLGVPPVLTFGTCTDCGRIAYLVGLIADALGVDIPQLPVAVTAPMYMEQKATIDAFAAVALGLYTHVAPIPPLPVSATPTPNAAPLLIKLLTEDVESITGGKVAVGGTAKEAVDGIEKHIEKKRKALGI